MDQKFRKSWINLINVKLKNKFKALMVSERFSIYEDIDKQVYNKYMSLLKDHKELHSDKLITIGIAQVLPDEFCRDLDEVLQEAAVYVVNNLKA